MAIVLLGDIGGTNARFELLRIAENEDELLKADTMLTSDFPSFVATALAFLEGQPTPEVAVVGIAGAVYNNTAHFVNQGWSPVEVSGESAAATLNIHQVVFFNDFVVAGYGCMETTPQDYFELNPGVEPMPKAPKAVMGPGTGIGECFITWNGQSYDVWPTEGGHADFAPKTELQWKYAKYMQARVDEPNSEFPQFQGLVGPSNELCFAGIGAHHMYYFLAQEFPDEVDPEFSALYDSDKTKRMELVMKNGFAGTNKLCVKAVNMWQEVMAYECGNWIAKTLPYGGFYLTGGMMAKNSEAIHSAGVFRNALYTKAPHIREIISRAPIYLLKDIEVGMKGARGYAKKLLAMSQ